MLPVALTIAGSDPSGGAGIQADLKTFHQHGVYGAAVITLLTVQNTQRLSRVVIQEPELVAEQIGGVAEDLKVAAVKTGALGSPAVVEAVADACRRGGLGPIVDPVRMSKAGAGLLDEDARQVVLRRLLPIARLVTPNLEELAWLSARPVATEPAMLDAGKALLDAGAAAVLLKGGHREGPPTDILMTTTDVLHLPGKRVETPHTHGVGCTLSAAICARLAHGEDLDAACRGAKAWLQRAIETAPGVGQGQGAVNHLASLS